MTPQQSQTNRTFLDALETFFGNRQDARNIAQYIKHRQQASRGSKQSTPKPRTIRLTADSSALTERLSSTTQLLQRLFDLGQSPLDLPDLPRELTRIHTGHSPTFRAGETRVLLQPSDALLEYETALLTRYRNLLAAQTHTEPPLSSLEPKASRRTARAPRKTS